jgi:hypothetical protein
MKTIAETASKIITIKRRATESVEMRVTVQMDDKAAVEALQ